MSDLISRSDLIEYLEMVTATDGITFETGFKQILTDINNAPKVEARPVVNGEWLIKEDESCFATWDYCSVCGFTMGFAGSSHYANFCPNCGASMKSDMRGGKNEEVN